MISISVIVPFYYGNEYMERLLCSIVKTQEKCSDTARFEVIIVNDSPGCEVVIPSMLNAVKVVSSEEQESEKKFLENTIPCKIIKNDKNRGIHYSRVAGLKAAEGEYIQFLDQDDEMVSDGYQNQIVLASANDVVVGNGRYDMGDKSFEIFKTLTSMRYLIQYERLIKIRNLVPSPGEVLIRKNSIPDVWKEEILKNNGADDWMLWVSLFKNGACYAYNIERVYIHHDTAGDNCSADLKKMYVSSLEVVSKLKGAKTISEKEAAIWKRAIDFKYLKDSGNCKFSDYIRYLPVVIDNVIYKVRLIFYDRTGSGPRIVRGVSC